jgi:hypothetical protein
MLKDHWIKLKQKFSRADETNTETTMKALLTSHHNQTVYAATITTPDQGSMRVYIVQEPDQNGNSPAAYHVIWNPATTPRELIQAALDHDKQQAIKLTAIDVPHTTIKPNTTTEALLNHKTQPVQGSS